MTITEKSSTTLNIALAEVAEGEEGTMTTIKRDPGRFVWESIGRSYWTRFGNLSISVCGRGSKKKGTLRWSVSDIFGNMHLGQHTWECLDDAILEAEKIATREFRRLLVNWRKAKVPR